MALATESQLTLSLQAPLLSSCSCLESCVVRFITLVSFVLQRVLFFPGPIKADWCVLIWDFLVCWSVWHYHLWLDFVSGVFTIILGHKSTRVHTETTTHRVDSLRCETSSLGKIYGEFQIHLNWKNWVWEKALLESIFFPSLSHLHSGDFSRDHHLSH